MIERLTERKLTQMLAQFPAVVLLGPRQAGKTTLAWQWARRHPSALYLDLELPSAQRQLGDAEAFLMAQRGRLVVLDEVQREPELFAVLRGVIDARRRGGEGAGQFLLLGSASGVLLNQSSESLAGRVAQVELGPLLLRELPDEAQGDEAGGTAGAARFDQAHRLWLRGGFALSWLAPTDAASLAWREAFITTYLERDIPALGPRLPATMLRRLWTMLAHQQGALLNQSQLAASLGVSGQTVARYIDLLCDLMLVRRLNAWHGNARKRLVRAPKVYVRDSGLVHALLGIPSLEALLAHPVAGASWEGFVLEQLLAAAPQAEASFYRTSHGAEADLVLRWPDGRTVAIEIKRSSAPAVSRGFHEAVADLGASQGATQKWVVAPVPMAYPGRDQLRVMSPREAVSRLMGEG